jgi:hypothetical protein
MFSASPKKFVFWWLYEYLLYKTVALFALSLDRTQKTQNE